MEGLNRHLCILVSDMDWEFTWNKSHCCLLRGCIRYNTGKPCSCTFTLIYNVTYTYVCVQVKSHCALTWALQCSCSRCSPLSSEVVYVSSPQHVSPISSYLFRKLWSTLSKQQASGKTSCVTIKGLASSRWARWNMRDLLYSGVKQGPDWIAQGFPLVPRDWTLHPDRYRKEEVRWKEGKRGG